MLEVKGFSYYDNAGPKVKLPSIIIANLVSPRVDYHGHDKSRIDTTPFITSIQEAIHKIAKGIQTFRAAGYVFTDDRHHDSARIVKKKCTREALEEFLTQIRR